MRKTRVLAVAALVLALSDPSVNIAADNRVVGPTLSHCHAWELDPTDDVGPGTTVNLPRPG